LAGSTKRNRRNIEGKVANARGPTGIPAPAKGQRKKTNSRLGRRRLRREGTGVGGKESKKGSARNQAASDEAAQSEIDRVASERGLKRGTREGPDEKEAQQD